MQRARQDQIALGAVVLAGIWIAVNVYEMVVHWDRYPFGWFSALTDTVTASAVGVLALAGMVWLIGRARVP